MEKIKVLIVEDQYLIAQDLEAKLFDHNFDVLNTVESGEEAIASLKKIQPDLILMDIQLAGALDGISTAAEIRRHYEIPIIYLSDHVDEKTVKRATLTHPANYLSKPFKIHDLLNALEIAFVNARSKEVRVKANDKLSDRIFLRKGTQSSIMIAYDDILYLEADRAYCNLITEKETHLLTNNMKKIFEQFENDDFIRIHRKYIININKIVGINGNTVELFNQHKVTVSKDYKPDFMKKINVIK